MRRLITICVSSLVVASAVFAETDYKALDELNSIRRGLDNSHQIQTLRVKTSVVLPAGSIADDDIACASGQILVGQTTGYAEDVAMSGDVKISVAGVTSLQENSVVSSNITDGAVAMVDLASAVQTQLNYITNMVAGFSSSVVNDDATNITVTLTAENHGGVGVAQAKTFQMWMSTANVTATPSSNNIHGFSITWGEIAGYFGTAAAPHYAATTEATGRYKMTVTASATATTNILYVLGPNGRLTQQTLSFNAP